MRLDDNCLVNLFTDKRLNLKSGICNILRSNMLGVILTVLIWAIGILLLLGMVIK